MAEKAPGSNTASELGRAMRTIFEKINAVEQIYRRVEGKLIVVSDVSLQKASLAISSTLN